jgi:hypothetical protein
MESAPRAPPIAIVATAPKLRLMPTPSLAFQLRAYLPGTTHRKTRAANCQPFKGFQGAQRHLHDATPTRREGFARIGRCATPITQQREQTFTRRSSRRLARKISRYSQAHSPVHRDCLPRAMPRTRERTLKIPATPARHVESLASQVGKAYKENAESARSRHAINATTLEHLPASRVVVYVHSHQAHRRSATKATNTFKNPRDAAQRESGPRT